MRTLVRLSSEGRPAKAIDVAQALDAIVDDAPSAQAIRRQVDEIASFDTQYAAALWARHVRIAQDGLLCELRAYQLGDVAFSLLVPLGLNPRLETRYQRPAVQRLLSQFEPMLRDETRLSELLYREGLRRGRRIEDHLHDASVMQVNVRTLDAEAAALAAASAINTETRSCRERELQWLVDELRIEVDRWRDMPWCETWAAAAAIAGSSPRELGSESRERLLALLFDGESLEYVLAEAFRAESFRR